MKKSIKVIALTALAAGMLAGCSSGGPVEPNWNWQDQQAMKDNLHGYVLPYVKGVSDLSVEILEAMGYVIVEGGEISSEDLAVYASNFKAEDGWVDLYAEEAEPEPEPEPEPASALRARLLGEGEEDPVDPEPEPEPEPVLEYMFEKRFETDEGGRYVHVEFGSYDLDDQPAEGGDFVLYALDPYEYSFPRDDIDAATLAMGSTISVPSLEADHYRFYDREGLTAVLCYLDSEEPDAGYCKILEAAGFYVYPPEEYEGDVYYLADSADEKYGLLCSWVEDMFVIQLESPFYSHSFPSAELNAIAAETYESSVEVVPFEDAPYYDFREEYDAAFCYGVDPETAVPAYTEALELAGWHVYGYDAAEEFYFADAPDFSYSVYYNVLFDDVLVVALTRRVSVEEFPAEEFATLADYYFYSDAVPASIDADYYFFSYAGFCDCFGLSAADAEGYGDLLEEEGWIVSFYTELLDDEETVVSFAWAPDASYCIYFYYLDGVFTIGMTEQLYFITEEYSAEAVAEIFAAAGADLYDIPAYVSTSEDTWFDTEMYLFFGIIPYACDVYVVDYAEDDVESYFESLVAAGWELTYDEENDSYEATKAFVELDGIATVEFTFSETDDETPYMDICMYFALEQIPAPEFPSEDLAAAFEALGVTPFEIPGPDGEGFTYEYEFDESNISYVDYPNYCYDNLYINNMSEEQYSAYLEKLEAEGWDLSGLSEAGAGIITKVFGDKIASVSIGWTSSTSYGEYCYMRIYYIMADAPSTEWPTEAVAEMLLENKITTTLPAFTSELGLGFEVKDMQIIVHVEKGTEAEALAAYINDLFTAGWTEYGEDDFGDMQYVSPDGALIASPWDGSLYDNDGYVIIDLKAAPSTDFPLDEVNAFLEEYELGFQLSEALPDAAGQGYEVVASSSSGYHYIKITVSGNALEAWDAIIAPIMEEAGYEQYTSSETKVGYSNDDYHEVDIVYNSSSDTTYIIIWE